jgi:ABC-2 type transport system permease protein
MRPDAALGAVRITIATAVNIVRIKIQALTLPFYVLTFFGFPFFQLLLVALIYRDNHALRNYAVIAGAGTALIFAMLYSGGENLEGERSRGTLGGLFVSPAPRISWLLGFQLSATLEAIPIAIVTVGLGAAIFGTSLSVNVPALLLTVVLLVLCMWGIGMMLSALGTAVRNANQISNMIFPLLTPLSGSMFPISEMPLWLRIPARCLPFGYGMQALVDAMTKNASIADLSGDLWPLLGFAIVLPILGALSFRRLDRYARLQGHLDMV